VKFFRLVIRKPPVVVKNDILNAASGIVTRRSILESL